jgi:putative membrane protein
VPAAEREAFVAEARKLFFAGAFIVAPVAVLAWVHAMRRGNHPSREQLTAWFADYPNPRLQTAMTEQRV